MPNPNQLPGAANAEPDKTLKYSVVPAGPGGLHIYVPGHWAMVNINLQNPKEEPAEITCATFFDSEPSLQYGRKVWMPPQSRMKISHPIFVPANHTEQVIHFHSLVESSGDVVREDTAQVRHSGSFFVSLKSVTNGQTVTEKPITGLLQNLESEAGESKNPPYDLLVACRVKLGQGRQIADLKDEFLPPDEESYGAIDQLVLCSSRLLNDHAGLAAIRQWVGGGGRLWIMLDSVDPEILSDFFGDDWRGQYVDRTMLAQVKIDPARPTLGNATDLVEYEIPLPFARVVVTPQEDVWYTVNGWPAAFWKTYGAGRVLVTTLGPEGWMRLNPASARAAEQARQANAQAAVFGQEGATPAPPPPPPENKPPQGPPGAPPGAPGAMREQVDAATRPNEFSLFDPNESMQRISEEFFARRIGEVPTATLVAEQADEYIGYKIPSRGKVLGTLLAFVLGLLGTALVLWRMERLELLGWSVPVLALAAGGWLVLLGRQSRLASEPLLAVVQIVHAIPGSHDYSSDGYGAVYSPEGNERVLGLEKGGRLMPDMTGLSGMNRRMEWTDLGNWQWQNLQLPPAQRKIELTRSGTTVRPFIAEATFGPEGLVGQLQLGDASGVSDAIIATPEGRLGVTLKPDGSFVAGPDDVLSSNQYLASTFLSDEQNRRQRTLRRILSSVDTVAKRAPVQIFAWTDPWVDGLKLDPGRSVKGAALVQMPLVLTRPAPGTPFVVPAPMLPFRNLRGTGPDGLTSSPIWNFVKNEGADRDQPGTAWFQFQAPTALEPFQALSARVRLEVSGPIGRLELAGWKDGQLEVLKEWIDPVGRVEFEITDPGVLTVSEGSVVLRVSAGDPSRPELTSRKEEGQEIKSTWRIESLSVDLKAQTLAVEGG